jgi:SNF family Na+-dependent transporter
MLPLSGLRITLLVGCVIKRAGIDFEMLGTSERVMQLWQLTIKYIAPFAIGLVFIMGVYDKFFA